MPFADVNGQHLYFEDSGGPGAAVIFAQRNPHGPRDVRAAGVGPVRRVPLHHLGSSAASGRPRPAPPSRTGTRPTMHWRFCLTSISRAPSSWACPRAASSPCRAALRAPGRVRGLGLIDTDAGVEPEESRPAYEAMKTEWETNGLSDPLAEAVASIIMSPGYDSSGWIAKWYTLPRDFIECRSGPSWTATTSGTGSRPSRPRPSSSTARPTPPSRSTGRSVWGTSWRAVELVRIPDAGHASNLSHPDEVTGPLGTFLRRHS